MQRDKCKFLNWTLNRITSENLATAKQKMGLAETNKPTKVRRQWWPSVILLNSGVSVNTWICGRGVTVMLVPELGWWSGVVDAEPHRRHRGGGGEGGWRGGGGRGEDGGSGWARKEGDGFLVERRHDGGGERSGGRRLKRRTARGTRSRVDRTGGAGGVRLGTV